MSGELADARRRDVAGVSFDPKIVLRPRALDEVLDLAVFYVRAHGRAIARGPLLAIALAFTVAWVALELLEVSDGARAFTLSTVSVLLDRLVVAWTGNHLFGNDMSIGEAAARVFARPITLVFSAPLAFLPWWPAYLGDFDETGTIVSLLLAFGLWPFLVALVFYLSNVLLLERLPLGKAIERATALVAQRYGRVLGFLYVVLVASLAFELGVAQVANVVLGELLQLTEVRSLDELLDEVSFANAVALALQTLVVAVARLFDYVDARTRVEGWDIQVRFKAIANRDGEGR